MLKRISFKNICISLIIYLILIKPIIFTGHHLYILLENNNIFNINISITIEIVHVYTKMAEIMLISLCLYYLSRSKLSIYIFNLLILSIIITAFSFAVDVIIFKITGDYTIIRIIKNFIYEFTGIFIYILFGHFLLKLFRSKKVITNSNTGDIHT